MVGDGVGVVKATGEVVDFGDASGGLGGEVEEVCFDL